MKKIRFIFPWILAFPPLPILADGLDGAGGMKPDLLENFLLILPIVGLVYTVWFLVGGSRQLTKIEAVLERSQAGLGKRIDENRELLELLYLDAPVLMKEKPWIAGWLHSQDEFLNDLAKAASVDLGSKVRAYPSPIGETNHQEGAKHAD